MQNSPELAKSRRHLTANVENKWLSNSHGNVNSANSQNATIRSGTLPEPRKRNLLLAKPLSLDASCAQMAPHIFGNPNKTSHILAHPNMPPRAFTHPNDSSVDFMWLDEPCEAQWCPLVLTGRDGEPRPIVAAPSPNPNGLDNTVDPVPKISGYVFNTLQAKSAVHVPKTNMNLINEDKHICDLNLYETIFQNWWLIDS